MTFLGIDIGGSGIKGALVDVDKGCLVGERLRLETPQPATPQAVSETVAELVTQFDWQGPIGCGFPAVISNGVAKSAANIDKSWIDIDVEQLIRTATGCDCSVINDADAAGLAEMRFGAGRERKGTVLVLTLGTGIGSALFYNGSLYPNSELGHLWLKTGVAEKYASAAVRKKEDLGWKAWAKRLNTFFIQVETLLSPELIIIGGGVSRKHDKFFPYLDLHAELLPAELRNQAGIVGSACRAAEIFA
ncbi:polyphosphate glucokinase [Malonomonas rubra DSM 5091]|uniref:Polyphosphate glucokinase n=1 Tax=Malonomonas rubra DSM 5091 TaxID=1122189 RepID=A0A1M6ETA9_MALRU|nr:ROK family protein [Malonomonas rubra]SHI88655.1 polyphosphate glucokinase [Malonomonas rubra DSM 5091]